MKNMNKKDFLKEKPSCKEKNVIFFTSQIPQGSFECRCVLLEMVFITCYLLSARHYGYPKPGKLSMDTSSSLALGGKGPTSASRLHDWGPKPLWSARWGSGIIHCTLEFVLQCGLLWMLAWFVNVSEKFFSLSDLWLNTVLSINSQTVATIVHQLVINSHTLKASFTLQSFHHNSPSLILSWSIPCRMHTPTHACTPSNKPIPIPYNPESPISKLSVAFQP